MKTIAIYFLQLFLCSGLLYAYYLLFLKNRKLHRFNRFFLLGSFLFSIAVPFIKVPFYVSLTKDSNISIQTLVKYNELLLPEVMVSSRSSSGADGIQFWYLLYMGIAFFLMVKIAAGVVALIKKRVSSTVQHWHSITIIETQDPSAPYSFFNWLFWARSVDEHSEGGKKILQHEYHHIRQRHSIDVLFTEIITAIAWINPFFWLMKNELKTVHEFSADAFAAGNTNGFEYATLLVTEAIHMKQTRLVHSFYNHQLKRRIAMLTSANRHRYDALRQWMAMLLFLFAAALFMISCQSANMPPKQAATLQASQPTVATSDSTQVLAPAVSESTAVAAADSIKTEVKKFTPPKIVKDAEAKATKRFTTPVVVKDNEPEVYTKVEQDARYSGDWSRYLTTNLRGEVPVENGAVPGNYQIIVQFIVDVEGNISDAKVIKDPGFGMGAEALRVIKQSGKWTPATMNGKNVKAYRKQPITFQVTEG
ncbi:M56 family metallopeptidase [Niabella sp. CC-SYL272]|uniref:M56 family metallopeptidase n=1 Tax=Niabella agricola TaxID=2891571 RepID=UPI001F259F65|nr:M56 family metallopeptidase [Niabella agricola]MCF3108400.1 M56 family metallopeptidase [Niabella agricola]